MSAVSESQSPVAAVLVVDDNPLIVNVVRSLLTTNHYQVFTASNGLQGLEVLEEKGIDVILCDVMMPELDGYAFHDRVRSDVRFAHIPFVFLTALGSQEEIMHGKEVGSDDYLVKPFSPEQLLAVVKGKVSRAHGLKNLSEERYEAYRKRVIHTLSHEFRTPLVAINTGTEILLEQQDELEGERIQNLISAIQRGGQRLERLVNDFMVLQQIEAGIAQKLFDTRKKLCTIGDFLEGYVENKLDENEFQECGLEFVDHCPGAQGEIYEPQITDCLDRLLGNAIKFNPKNDSIEIVCYTRSDEIAIEVRDRGIGLDPDRIKEAIDVFGQIDRERLEQQGGGLGLAIANRYVSLNNGSLEFTRREGGGAVVTIVLPLVSEESSS